VQSNIVDLFNPEQKRASSYLGQRATATGHYRSTRGSRSANITITPERRTKSMMPGRQKRKSAHARGSPNHETLWPCTGCGQVDGRKGRSGVQCIVCRKWWHSSCAGISTAHHSRSIGWSCPRCISPSHTAATTASPQLTTREDVQRTNLSGIFKLNSVFERTISCNNNSGFNLKIPDTAKEIMYFKINLLCIIELINHFQVY
jgi:hypothetical protein